MVKLLIYQNLTQISAPESNICAVDQVKGGLVKLCRFYGRGLR